LPPQNGKNHPAKKVTLDSITEIINAALTAKLAKKKRKYKIHLSFYSNWDMLFFLQSFCLATKQTIFLWQILPASENRDIETFVSKD
jgi:hypothetical protein